MALDERYVVASDLEQYFVDKDSGLPLSNGTLTFYRDTARNVPKEVFQLSGSPPNYTYTSMGAQITLSAVGTVQNSGGDNEVIYYFPYDAEGNLDLYYVVVRDQDGIEQFTREAWPNITSANDPTRGQFPVSNQISNPTFTNVFINEDKTTTFTITGAVNQVFEFAPNWDFVLSGTGTVTVQRIAITGNENIPTSPPYVIDINVSVGVTACYLRQRFPYNSGLWASTPNNPIFLAATMVARNESVGTTGVQMFYVESSGGSPILILDATFQSNYQLISGSSQNQIPASLDTNSGRDGYVDIYLSFIAGSHVRITSLQVIPTASHSVNLVTYDTDSSNREEAYQGDYYIPRSAAKRIPSFLIGWDFQVNPFQFGFSGNIGATASYIVDQTIALRGATGNVAWDTNPATYGIRFTTAGVNDAFYLLQYLNGDQVKNMIGTRLSVNVFAYQAATGDNVTMRVYLFRGSAAAAIPTLPTSIGTLAADGTFTLTAANWTAIARSGLDIPQATLNKLLVNSDINDGNNDYGFSGWEIVDSTQIGDTDKFAIVVTFHYPDTSTQLTVNSISMVPGDLPCRPAVKSFQDTLNECQYYYEKSYNSDVTPGTATTAGAIVGEQAAAITGGSFLAYPRFIPVRYKSRKRIAVSPTYFATNGLANNVVVQILDGASTAVTVNAAITGNWGLTDSGDSSFALAPVNRTVALNAPVAGAPSYTSTEAIALFHYIADARLGIV